MEKPLELRPAGLADEELLLNWRNEPETREQSFQTEAVGVEEHGRWLRRTLARASESRLYVGELDGAPVGQVRIERRAEATGEISVSVDSALRGRGLGSRLIALASARAAEELDLNEIVAVVKDGNEGSRRAFRRAGYGRERAAAHAGEPALELTWEPPVQR